MCTCLKAGRSILEPFLPEFGLSEGRIDVRKVSSVVDFSVIVLSEYICVTTHRIDRTRSKRDVHACLDLILLCEGH